MPGPATKEALERAEKIRKTQSFAPGVEDPGSLPDSPSIITATGEINGSRIKVLDKDGVVKEVRTKATIIHDSSSRTSRVIAGTPEKLGLSQIKRINPDFYRRARAALASEAKRIKQRSKRKEES